MARVLVGVTGGIAAYKACELVRLLVRAGHDVIPLVTPGADRFVRAETFHALARRAPSAELYPHLERADLLVIAPLTANTLAQLAHGLADNVVAEAALAQEGPVLVAPAMNTRMWNHPATRGNVEILRGRGVELVGPEEGDLAEGERGIGRMAEPVEILARAEALLEPSNTVLRGKTVVVQAPTAADLAEATLARADADVVVMAAAVSDYRPAHASDDKRPKDDARWNLELEPTDDILRRLGAQSANGRILVGFAAEAGAKGLERARAKRTGKNADLVVYNDVARSDVGFESLENEVVLISDAGERAVGKAPKQQIAAEILDEVERLLEASGGRTTS